jgi:hypothetical protein
MSNRRQAQPFAVSSVIGVVANRRCHFDEGILMKLRVPLSISAVAVLALLMTGCTTSQPTAGASSGSPPGASPGESPVESPAAPEAGPSATPTAGRAEAAQTSRCHTSEVRVTAQGAPGGGAAGNLYEWLVFINTSARTCTLFGFPGVSYVRGPSGAQVNQPARRTSDTPHRITLNPQQSAHAQVHTGQPGNFPADTCKPVQVDGYRVYVPDETAAVFVAARSQQCSANATNVPSVGPVEAN